MCNSYYSAVGLTVDPTCWSNSWDSVEMGGGNITNPAQQKLAGLAFVVDWKALY